MNEDACVKLCL